MKKICIHLIWLGLLLGGQVLAQDVLMAWDFAGNTGSEVSDVADTVITHVSAAGPSGEIVRGPGLGAPINMDRFNAANWETSGTPDLAGNQYMEFTIAPDAGYGLELTDIACIWQSSGTGPDALAFASDLDGFGAVIGSPFTGRQNTTPNSDTLTLNLPPGTFGTLFTPVTFRVYGYAAGGTAGTGGFESSLSNTNDLIIRGYVIEPEPTNHVSDFQVDSLSGTAVQANWTEDVAGPQLPDGYLLLARSTAGPAFPAVADGTPLPDDLDLSDGLAVVNLSRGDTGYVFTDLSPGTTYELALFPYTNPNSGINLDYKTDLVIPADDATTPGGCNGLFVSEYVESASEKYLEIYNGTGDIVDLSQYEVRRYANGATSFGTIPLSGYLAAEDVLVLGDGGSLFAEDITSGNIDFSGNDALALLDLGSGDTLDVFGRIGEDPGAGWTSVSWSTDEQVLIRDPLIRSGVVINPLAGFPTLEGEWTGFTDLVADNGLGSHDATGGCATGVSCATPGAPSGLTIDDVKTGSITLSFTGGSGADRHLVIISSDPGAQPIPTDGVIYGPGEPYGSTGTVLSFDGSTSGMLAGELTPNTTYFFTLFSYTSVNCANGPVYNGTPAIISQTTLPANPTELFPGDLMIVGYDSNIGNGGEDRLVLVALRDLGANTSFTLTNAVYEVGDPANVRSGRWFDAGGSAGTNIDAQRLTLYDPVAAGSILCLDLPSNFNILISQVAVDGTPLVSVRDFDVENVGNGPGLLVNLADTEPDPLFVMQGDWDYSSGTHGIFNGRILSGLMNGDFWWSVSDDLSSLTATADRRRSRIPPEITCLAIQGATSTPASGGTFGFYPVGAPHSGTQRDLLAEITDVASNWTISTSGTNTNDLALSAPGLCDSTFSVSAPAVAGRWLGGDPAGPVDWFTCGNWDNYQVPDSTVDVTIAAPVSANPSILTGTTASRIYDDQAACRDLSLQSSAAPLSASGETLYVHGTWDNSATPPEPAFAESGSTVEFRGATDQSLNPSNNQPETFENLVVNKPSGLLQLASDAIVIPNGQLSLTQGLVNANGFVLSVQNTLPTGILVHSAQSYLYNGNLSRRVEPSIVYDYPVGTATTYQLARLITQVNFELATTFDSVVVSFSPAIGSPVYTSNFDGTNYFADLLDGGLWTMTPSGSVSGGAYGVELNLLGSSNDGGAGYRVMKTNASGQFGLFGAPGGAGPIAGGVQATETGYAAFSDFGIGQNVGTTFPVEWLRFTATPQGEAVALAWSTAREVNHSHYVVERSADGQRFEALGHVEGPGQGPAKRAYAFTDGSPLTGRNVYRIRQVDLDGAVSYSELRSVQMGHSARLTLQRLFPNPTQDRLHLDLSLPGRASGQLVLLDAQGRIAHREPVDLKGGTQRLAVSTGSLPAGVYLLRLRANGEQVSARFVRE